MPPSAAPEWLRTGWILETTATSAPASKASIAARIPAQPAPTIRTSCLASTGKGRYTTAPVPGVVAYSAIVRSASGFAARSQLRLSLRNQLTEPEYRRMVLCLAADLLNPLPRDPLPLPSQVRPPRAAGWRAAPPRDLPTL